MYIYLFKKLKQWIRLLILLRHFYYILNKKFNYSYFSNKILYKIFYLYVGWKIQMQENELSPTYPGFEYFSTFNNLFNSSYSNLWTENWSKETKIITVF